MPFRNSSSAAVSRAGWGHRGYCALCSFKDEVALNERIAAKWNARQVNDWLRTHYDGLTFDRQTIYKHKREHMGHPEDRLVTAVEKTKALEPKRRPRATTNEQFLEAVRDIGYERAVEHPDEITVDHALKAAQILTTSKRGGGDVLIALVNIMTGVTEAEVIEGTYQEV